MITKLIFAVVCFVYIQQSTANCCRSSGGGWWRRGICGDGTVGTPCCGFRSCNALCCSCGECRGRRRRDVSFTAEATAYFNGLDINKNGMMEKCEFNKALANMKITDNVTVLHHWTIMDKNNDGVITFKEFDHNA